MYKKSFLSTYIISDVHGSNESFQRALKNLNFKKNDSLYILGDLIDRGDDSKGVLDTVFTLLENGYRVECLRGNHEQMLLDSFEDSTKRFEWLNNGGNQTLYSFLTTEIENIPVKYIDFIKAFKTHAILNNNILVHAGINMLSNMPFEDTHSLLWLRNWKEVFDANWLGDRYVIHGHTPMERKKILEQDFSKLKVICIDNGSYLKRENFGSICTLRLEDHSITFHE